MSLASPGTSGAVNISNVEEWNASTIEAALDRGGVEAIWPQGSFKVWRTGPESYAGEATIGGIGESFDRAPYFEALERAIEWAAQCEE